MGDRSPGRRPSWGRWLVSACWVAALTVSGCSDEEESLAYRLVPVGIRDIVVSALADGVIEPVQTIEVKSKASGEITEVSVEIGDKVDRGDLLVRVDQRGPRNAVMQAEADLQVAQAELENAESQLRRSERLYGSQAITEQEWESARLDQANAAARLIRAERDLQDARIAFEDTEVRAATHGTILSKQVEVGTVIQSASSGMGGGAVLLTMADLDTVQIRTLVDETDIGKIQPGYSVTISVDAYANRAFGGRVLKIEPLSVTEQNVTKFPVLVRIGNESGLLRPGMNADVEIHIGSQEGVLAVPNTALRTERDLESAASILGLEVSEIQEQLAAARATDRPEAISLGEEGRASGAAPGNTVRFQGRSITLPAGLTVEQVEPVLRKVEQGGFQVFQSLSSEERSVMSRLRGAMGGGPGGRPRAARAQDGSAFQFGGNYVVFVVRGNQASAVPVRTGLTDLDYSEVASGLAEGDTVLVLPSTSLVQSRQEWQERISRMSGGGIFGGRR